MKADLVNLGIGQAGAIAILGYLVVFLGLVLLMLVVLAMASYFISKAKKPVVTEGPAPEPVKTAAPAAEPEKKAPPAPGTAGEFKLYNTDPRDAANGHGDRCGCNRNFAQSAALQVHQGG